MDYDDANEDVNPQNCSTSAKSAKYTESLNIFSRSLKIFICEKGPWDLKVANAFCSIGNIYICTGMLHEALAMYEKDLQVCLHSLDPANIRVAGAKYNAGLASCRIGRYSEALALLEDCFHIRVDALGPQHILVAHALAGIGGVYSCTGRHTEALERYQQDIVIRRAIDPDNYTLALSLRNSASARACLGQNDQAIQECGEVHVLFLPQLGPLHPFTIKTHQMLANLASDDPKTIYGKQVYSPDLKNQTTTTHLDRHLMKWNVNL
jgi:tetratricopeptide (TPR) repeat protein